MIERHKGTDKVYFCNRCGLHAQTQVRNIGKPCEGPAKKLGKAYEARLKRMREGKHPTSGTYWSMPKTASSQVARASGSQGVQRRVRLTFKQPEKPTGVLATEANTLAVCNQEGVGLGSVDLDPSWEQRIQEEADLYEELAIEDSFFAPVDFW